MAPKPKTRKSVAPQTPKQKGKRASRRKQQPPLDLAPINKGASSADEGEEPSLKTMMSLLVDINSRLYTNEQHVENGEKSHTTSPSPAPANPSTSRGAVRRGVMSGTWHADNEAFLEIADEVRARVASRLRGAPALFLMTMDDDTPARRKKGIKSGMLDTADTPVLKRFTRLHEVVYTSAGQPAVYEEMNSVLFVNGYLTVMVDESEELKPHMLRHLQELIGDDKAYGWESVLSYHAAWLQDGTRLSLLVRQGQEDQTTQSKGVHRVIPAHKITSSPPPAPLSRPGSHLRHPQQGAVPEQYLQPALPDGGQGMPGIQHCLTTVQHIYYHTEQYCCRKGSAKNVRQGGLGQTTPMDIEVSGYNHIS